MKNLLFLTAILVGVFACKPKTDGNAEAAHDHGDHAGHSHAVEADEFFNLSSGTLYWTGTKPIGEGHTGTVNISEGKVGLADGNLVSGAFAIDMTTISSTDLEGEAKGKLEGHLKTGDFFEVDKFPTATFEVTGAEAVEGIEGATHNVVGNLTMKGQTDEVTIPANVLITDDKISVVSKSFEVDRTKWGVTFSSGTFIEDLVKDKIIDDMIKLNLNFEATK